jgi:hypothetical protein
MNDPGAPPKDRLVAARDLLDRAGYKPVEKVAADVQATVETKHDLKKLSAKELADLEHILTKTADT